MGTRRRLGLGANMQCLAACVLEYNPPNPSEQKRSKFYNFLIDNRITDSVCRCCCWSDPSVIRGYTYINSRGGGMMEQWLNNGRNQIRDSPHTPLPPHLCHPCAAILSCATTSPVLQPLLCYNLPCATCSPLHLPCTCPALLLLPSEPQGLSHWHLTATACNKAWIYIHLSSDSLLFRLLCQH